MRRILWLFAAGAVLWAAVFAAAQQEVLVRFKKNVRPETRDSVLHAMKLKPKKTIPQLNLVVCEAPANQSIEELRKSARTVPVVDYIEPNVTYAAEPEQQAEQIAQAKLHFKLEKLEEMQFAPQRLIVKFKKDASPQQINQFLAAKGLQKIQDFAPLRTSLCKISAGISIRSAVVAAAVENIVEYVEPDFVVHAYKIPNDPRFADQWGLNNTGQTGGKKDADVDAPEAWDQQTGDASVLVGIVDTGIDFSHPDLSANIWHNPGETGNGKETNGIDDDGNGFVDDWRGWDFANSDNNPQDDNGHGTHVAGIIAASGDNGKGVAGVVWRASLVPLKFLAADGSGFVSNAVSAILYAADNGIRILNNSWGGTQYSQALEDAIRYASDHGVLFVAAAGNDGEDNDTSPHYPSNYDLPNLVSVAASDDRDRRASFSNYGDRSVDLAAPGEDIFSTYPGGRYEWLSGTSMATPFVTGAAALIRSEFPDISMAHLKLRILGSVDYLSEWDGIVATAGRLNVHRAISRAPILALTTDYGNTNNTSGPYNISTFAIDDEGIASVRLIYSTGGASSDTVAMSRVSQDSYRAGIPGQPVGTEIRYRVLAEDVSGNQTLSRTFRFEITRTGGCCGQLTLTIPGPVSPQKQIGLFLLNLLLFLAPFYILRRRARKQNTLRLPETS